MTTITFTRVDEFCYLIRYNNDDIHCLVNESDLWLNFEDVKRIIKIHDVASKVIHEIIVKNITTLGSQKLCEISKFYIRSEDLLNKLKNKPSKRDLYTFLGKEIISIKKKNKITTTDSKVSDIALYDKPEATTSSRKNIVDDKQVILSTIQTFMKQMEEKYERMYEQSQAESQAQRERDRAEHLAQRTRDRAEHLAQRTRDRAEHQSQLLAITDSMGALRQKIEGRRAVTVHNRTRPQDQECVTIMRCNVNPRKYYFIRAQYQSLADRISTLQRDHNRFPAGLTLVKRLHSPNAVRLLKVLANRYHAYILRQDCCIIYRREQNTINGEAGWTERQMMQHIYDIYDNNVMERDTTSMPPLDDHDVLPLDEGEQRDYDQLYSDPHLLNDHDSFDDFDE